ncbi:HlyD family secretion protein [Pseudomonas tolaasii]|uniref:HlyD family secretion protein n=1 Tax=Pseudomonas tolaasii TaxID=29442 RepID=UPI00031207DC|nr:efflux RND transporter periplasmic adaptor subunit [Pseudomonas tolaasii]
MTELKKRAQAQRPTTQSTVSLDEHKTALSMVGSARFGLIVLMVMLLIVGAGLWLARREPSVQLQGLADADSIRIAAKISGRLQSLQVNEGDQVEPGQLLFVLDSAELEARWHQANAQLMAALAQKAKVESGVRVEEIQVVWAQYQLAQVAAKLASTTYIRVENLYQQGVVTLQSRDEARAQSHSAQAKVRAARAKYQQAVSGTRSEDKTSASAHVLRAEAALVEVSSMRSEARGVAPQAAYVDKRLADIGELVPAGYPVLHLVNLKSLWVALYLREDQFKAVQVGQVLRGDIPALGKTDVDFELYFIRPAGDFATWRATRQSSGYDVKNFEVRLRPQNSVEGFRPGMSVLFKWPQS